MFRELREQAGLTRVQLAARTNRTVNYLLKAEQLTFPSPPVALMDYYIRQGYNRTFLSDWYYSDQRAQRILWLTSYLPYVHNQQQQQQQQQQHNTKQQSFRFMWVNPLALDPLVTGPPVGALQVRLGVIPNFSDIKVYPTEYELSRGLCIPASSIYYLLKHPEKKAAGSIIAALNDLKEHLEQYGTSQYDHDYDLPEDYNMYEQLLAVIKAVGGTNG